jgi:hypothetical protein
MSNQLERTHVAIEYFKALRTETIERLKMRDRILFGYLGATAALIGYGQEHADFKFSLIVLVPFLALGAATSIVQHQDQIVAFNEYITLELIDDLPETANPVRNFYGSKAGINHLFHNITMNLVAQLTLLCGPPLFVFLNGCPYFQGGWSLKEFYGSLGLILTVLTAARIWLSRNFRKRIMSKLGSVPEAQKTRRHHAS